MSFHPFFAEYRVPIAFAILSAAAGALTLAACAESPTSTPDRADSSVTAPSDGVDAGATAPDASDAAAAVPDVPCAVGNVCRVQTPLPTGAISALSGRSEADVWAAGSLGLMMRYDGRDWTRLGSAEVPEDLTTPSSLFLNADRTWTVAGMRIRRREIDADSVRAFSLADTTRTATSIVAIDGGGVYIGCTAGGRDGIPTSYKGALFEIADFDVATVVQVPDPLLPATNQAAPMNIRGMAHVAAKTLWTVGERGAVARYPLLDAGGRWAVTSGTVLALPIQQDLFAAWAEGDHLWAAGDSGVIVHFDGADWHTQDSGTQVALRAIFGFSQTDVWAAGDAGTLLHFDGTSWSHVPIQSYSGSLRALWGGAPNDVWIGGERAMFHWGPLP